MAHSTIDPMQRPLAWIEQKVTEETGCVTKLEFHSLTKGEKNAVITTVALAALTAIAGAVFLAGVGSIGATPAWAMVGSGAGVALLVSIPLAIIHSTFNSSLRSMCSEPEEGLNEYTDFIIFEFKKLQEEKLSFGKLNKNVMLIHRNKTNRIIIMSKISIYDQICTDLIKNKHIDLTLMIGL